MNSSMYRKLLWSVVLGILIYAVFAFFTDLDGLLRAGAQFNWYLFPLVLALALCNYLLRLGRWWMYLRDRGIAISFGQGAVVFFSGLAMSVSPGKFGELIKAEYIRNIAGAPRRRSAPVIVAERLTDLIGVLILASFGVFHFRYGEVVFFIVLAVILAALIVISTRGLALWFVRLLRPLPFFGSRIDKLEDAYENISALTRPRQLLAATFLSVCAWACEAFGFHLVLSSLPGVDVSITTAFFIYAFAILVGAVTMLPGGLGATEGAMTGLLVLLNTPAAPALAATLITRLATLWFAVLVGLVCTAAWRRLLGEAQHVSAGSPSPGEG